MKVRCINNEGYETRLSIGKIYNVHQGWSPNCWVLMADDGGIGQLSKARFEIVKENDNMKELTLQEVFKHKDGTKIMVVIGNEECEIEIHDGDIFFSKGDYEGADVVDIFNLQDIINARYYLLNEWQEIDYYTAYTTTNSNIKFVSEDEEIVGTHYYILSKLNSDCMKNNKNLNEVLSNGKWFIKAV